MEIQKKWYWCWPSPPPHPLVVLTLILIPTLYDLNEGVLRVSHCVWGGVSVSRMMPKSKSSCQRNIKMLLEVPLFITKYEVMMPFMWITGCEIIQWAMSELYICKYKTITAQLQAVSSNGRPNRYYWNSIGPLYKFRDIPGLVCSFRGHFCIWGHFFVSGDDSTWNLGAVPGNKGHLVPLNYWCDKRYDKGFRIFPLVVKWMQVK